MNKDLQILELLNIVASALPLPIYWEDINGVILGGNEEVLKSVGITNIGDYIGKTPYDLYPKKIAETLLMHSKIVLEKNTPIKFDESIKDATTGKLKFFTAIKAPLYNDKGNVIGVVGTAIDVTAEKESEALRIKNEKYEAEKRGQEKLIGLIDIIISTVQNYKMDMVNGDNGGNKLNKLLYRNVKLSNREEQVLYLLAMGKTPKDIARILGKLDGKNISFKTIASVINKQLYRKLDATNYSDLIDKATRLGLIKLIPESLSNLFSDKVDEL